MAVHFFSADRPIPLRDRNRLKAFLNSLVRKEGRRLDDLNVIFCSDEYLLQVNRQYLNHDYYTDIITFDITEVPGKLSGEMYISTDRVRENARQLGQPLSREMHRVIFHGVLHLCGYSDKTRTHQLTMRQREDHYLQQYG